MINIGLVDDHIITRKGIKSILELNNELSVIVEASNGIDLLNHLSNIDTLPDVIILDITMPLMNGVELIGNLTANFPHINTIVFSLLGEEDTIIDMISRGASGYVSKSSDPLILIEAIQHVFRYGFYLGDLVKKEYFTRHKGIKSPFGFYGKEILSPKEVRFVKLAASNKNYEEIASIMEIRPKTLENYRDKVFQKLGINNRAALAVYALKIGLV